MANIHSYVFQNSKPVPCSVTVEITDGIGIHMVGKGLPDASIKEILLRVCTALQSKGFSVPGKKIAIYVSPIPKGCAVSSLDLAVALAILVESGQAECKTVPDTVFGELGLDGSIRLPQGFDEEQFRLERLSISLIEFGRLPELIIAPKETQKKKTKEDPRYLKRPGNLSAAIGIISV